MIFSTVAAAIARTVVHVESEETNATVSEKFRISDFHLDRLALAQALRAIQVRDHFTLEFSHAGSDQPVSLSSCEEAALQTFCRMVTLHLGEEHAATGTLSLSIIKGFDARTASLYSLAHIEAYWRAGGLEQAATKLKSLAEVAYILESAAFSETFRCGLFIFRPFTDIPRPATNPESADKHRLLAARDKACLFYESKAFPFIPEDFSFDAPLPHAGIGGLFSTLKLAFALIFIADISSLNGHELTVTLKGYRHITSPLKLASTSDADLAQGYYEIYVWAYSEGGVTDKLGIARNLLSIHVVKENFRDVRDGALQAMISNHSIYLKENVKQYIDIKNKLSDQLQKQSEKAGDMVKSIGSYLRASVFSVYSFIVTTFIIRSLSKSANEGTFTTGIYCIFLMFVLLSLGTLWYALRETDAELARFTDIYQSFKTRHDDLLSKSDRDRILQNDRDFKRDCEYIQASRRRALTLWLGTLGVVLAIVSLVKLLGW